jgi:glycosyltransferase involved in cell wall biosynthesis
MSTDHPLPKYVVALKQPVSILMPVYNEAEVIEAVVEEWVADVIRYLPEGSELVFDEGGSNDGTREILGRLCTKYPFIRVIYNERKDGFANAARRLYTSAKCPWVFFTDSDGQYIASDFWKIAKFADRYDYIRGGKIGRKDPIFRRIASAIFNKSANFIYNFNHFDINSAFHLIKREVVLDLLPQITVMPLLIHTEMIIRAELANYEIKQIYVMHRERKAGQSRGLPTWRFIFDSLAALKGLLDIQDSYRK